MPYKKLEKFFFYERVHKIVLKAQVKLEGSSEKHEVSVEVDNRPLIEYPELPLDYKPADQKEFSAMLKLNEKLIFDKGTVQKWRLG